AQPEILRDIGVLIFVHQHIFKTVLPLGEYLGVALKNGQYFEQKVSEISCVQYLQSRLIGSIKLATLAIRKGLRFPRRNFIRCQAAVLPAINENGELAGGPTLLINVFCLNDLLHQADLVIGIENGEI